MYFNDNLYTILMLKAKLCSVFIRFYFLLSTKATCCNLDTVKARLSMKHLSIEDKTT